MAGTAAISISALQPSEAKPAGGKRAEDSAGGFSFNAAMTALETRASASLETFGGAPKTGGALGAPSTAAVEKNTAPAQSAAPEPGAPQSREPASTEPAPAEPAPVKPAASQSTAPTQAAPAPIQPVSSAPLTALQAVQAAPQQASAAQKVDIAPARAADASRAETLKAPKAPAKAQAAQPPDFAKLIARKLDGGATQFEFRLDPPELGRVEAQLRLGDKDDAALVLKFENQTALDMFARDEAALRLALSTSGHDFSGKPFVFELASAEPAPKGADAPALAAAGFSEPLFAAPFSSGALDIRI